MNEIILGDCRKTLKNLQNQSVNCCITSPPYFGLRDYGHKDQIGLESTPEEYIKSIVDVFREVKRVLRDDGTLWLNLGDSYTGSGKGGNPEGSIHQKQLSNRGTIPMKGIMTECFGLGRKQLLGIPWKVAFALQADGWYLRQDIIWSKPNPMPESVTDRCTKSHEYIFLLSKSEKYYFDNEAIREQAVWDIDGQGTLKRKERQKDGAKSTPTEIKNGIRKIYPNGKHGNNGNPAIKSVNGTRNKRSVWTVTTKPYKGSHFATFPIDLIEPCVLAGCPSGGTILDPFGGSGTTAIAANRYNRNSIICEINKDYVSLANNRIAKETAQKTMVFDEVINE